MELSSARFTVETERRFEILNVTPEVEATLERLDAGDGLVVVSTPHTSAALSTNEHDEALLDDMVDTLTALVPPDDGYAHDVDHVDAGEQPNAHAHLLSALVKRPVVLLREAGQLGLGPWEDVLFFEFCGPRTRRVEVALLR